MEVVKKKADENDRFQYAQLTSNIQHSVNLIIAISTITTVAAAAVITLATQAGDILYSPWVDTTAWLIASSIIPLIMGWASIQSGSMGLFRMWERLAKFEDETDIAGIASFRLDTRLKIPIHVGLAVGYLIFIGAALAGAIHYDMNVYPTKGLG